METKYNFPPNTNPQTYSFIATAIGYICTINYNIDEQNSIGNWLILVGQFILTNAAQQQLIESRKNKNINNYNNIDLLIDALNKMQQELNNLNGKI